MSLLAAHITPHHPWLVPFPARRRTQGHGPCRLCHNGPSRACHAESVQEWLVKGREREQGGHKAGGQARGLDAALDVLALPASLELSYEHREGGLVTRLGAPRINFCTATWAAGCPVSATGPPGRDLAGRSQESSWGSQATFRVGSSNGPQARAGPQLPQLLLGTETSAPFGIHHRAHSARAALSSGSG